MCGIFGVINGQAKHTDAKLARKILDKLYLMSESRGKEASGFALRLSDKIQTYKTAEPASKLIKSRVYKTVFEEINSTRPENYAMIGHSRLVTNGNQLENNNNQPVIKNNTVGIHNGIICNVDDIWQEKKKLKREYEVDTEILFALFREEFGKSSDYFRALVNVFDAIEGAASVALFPEFSKHVLLATNTGSLYYTSDQANGMVLFASERYILERVLESLDIKEEFGAVVQLPPDHAAIIKIDSGALDTFGFDGGVGLYQKITPMSAVPVEELKTQGHQKSFQLLRYDKLISPTNRKLMWERWEKIYRDDGLKRCSRCALPETMTFIEFNEDGVCSYCRNAGEFKVHGVEKLKNDLQPYLGNYDGRDCLVGISGGRDSCYGLHFLKEEMGLNPLAFTFDWAVVTDLARRNISRMCSKLGVEHIIFSADINRKRDNIRKNLTAWLEKPVLGVLPLIMAGDKEMLLFGKKMIKQTGLKALIWCNGHNHEHTPFKSGFAGMAPEANTFMNFAKWKNKFGYFYFFLKEFAKNKSYINSSILDSFMAALWQFVIPLPQSTFLLFNYIPWNEDIINETLIKTYNWELAPDTTTTWRIGDGTAAFYNYIYMAIAGISEHDSFRSSQIREKAITRGRALELISEDNKPRIESIEWYANIIGIDVNKAIETINNFPRLYA